MGLDDLVVQENAHSDDVFDRLRDTWSDLKEYYSIVEEHGFFYIHKGVMHNGEPILIPKIRTHYPKSDNIKVEHAEFNELGKLIDDPRVIPFARGLRKRWIDEMPQFFYNVIWKRNMNLVGIRPRTEEEWRTGFTKEHRIHADKYKRGLMGVHYAQILDSRTSLDKIFSFLSRKKEPYSQDKLEGLSKVLRLEEIYLERKDAHSFWTDVDYAVTIFYNMFKGMRSS